MDPQEILLDNRRNIPGNPQISPPFDPIFARKHPQDRFGISLMLLNQNALCQRVRIVFVQNWDDFLQHDYAVIQMLIYKMYCAAGDLCAVVEGLRLGFQAWKGG